MQNILQPSKNPLLKGFCIGFYMLLERIKQQLRNGIKTGKAHRALLSGKKILN